MMAGVPVDQARHVIPRQAMWKAIRARRDAFTAPVIAAATKINDRTVRTYLDALVAGAVIEVSSESAPIASKGARKAARVYRLVKDCGVEAPRLTAEGKPVTAGASREQMWRTMKIVGTFSAADLAVQASLPESVVQELDAADYCRRLAKAGYLATVAGGRKGVAGKAVYRFLPTRDTGPLAPMVQRLKTVFDPNTRKIAWQEEPRA